MIEEILFNQGLHTRGMSVRTQTLITDRHFSGKFMSTHCSQVLCGGYAGWRSMLTCIQKALIKALIRVQLVASMYGIYLNSNTLREARPEESNIGGGGLGWGGVVAKSQRLN